jgi:glycosyltransferase involved in cell wall biosynthesis
MSSYAPGITVIVPTYKRVADLDRCLAGLEQQTLPPAEILICYRQEDMETVEYLARKDRHGLAARLILCDMPGQVYALSKAIDATRTDLLAITDDDSIPKPDWLERMVAHFDSDPRVGGVGGRDHVWEHGHWLEGDRQVVGLVQWNGTTVGNHHLGVGPARPVHILKGVNMGYRKSALGDLRPDPRLRGKGAQVGNDMQLSLQLVAKGYTLIYDPAVLVEHFPGVRPVEEDRAYFNAGFHFDEIYNRTLILLEFLKTQPWGRLRQIALLLFLVLRGTRKAPGLLMLAIDLATRYPNGWARFRATFRAYGAALAAAR